MNPLEPVTYPSNFEQKIGFDKIRQLLSEKCLSPLGKERIEQAAFSDNYETIAQWLEQTDEFLRILKGEDEFPANFFFDVRYSLKRIRPEGTWLDEKELFDLKRSLQTINDIVRFLKPTEDEEIKYPALTALAGEIMVFPHLVESIDTIIDKFGKIKDNASPTLARIRSEIASTLGGISRSLQSILRAAQTEGFVEKDVAPTMRDGRLMIPVAPAFKRKIKGIVHDESASGKTVFVEPEVVVEANNRVRELESDERREIVRILTEFTNQIRPVAPDILNSYEFLADIDFIRAKALLADDIQAIKPRFEDKRQVDWARAIHPLLFLSLKKQGKSVVPLDIELTEERRILLISGPNAGGKSVCLKTVGLLQYMLQCGLLIPLHESSRTGLFSRMFIDIGDEQSIENDLSGAIAEALLDRFNRNGSFGVITTHYQNLKHFAEEMDGIVNGAMLYDRHLMRPLFTLSIGNPGSSFAIEIARKIGLPEEVIADASEKVGADYINMDKYLQDIVRDKRYWENKRQNVRQQEKRLEEITARYEKELAAINQQRKEIIQEAKNEAERLLTESNAKIENTIREIREAQADKEQTKLARQSLQEFKTGISATQDENEKLAREMAKIKARNERKNKRAKEEKPKGFDKETIREGDLVRLKGQTSAGNVLSIDGKQAVVAFGMIKSTLKLDQLEKVSNNQIKKEMPKSTFISEKTRDEMHEKKLHFKQEIDVRGMRGDEALQTVTYFIDDAIQVGASKVRILHGTGSGILRQLIRDYLSTVPGVRRYHDEHVQFGGAGITVVELG